MTIPNLGRTVIFKLSAEDAKQINRRRTTGGAIAQLISEHAWPMGAQAHIGAEVKAGDEFPMIVVREWSPVMANGQVLLDGNDVFYATSVTRGLGEHEWRFTEQDKRRENY